LAGGATRRQAFQRGSIPLDTPKGEEEWSRDFPLCKRGIEGDSMLPYNRNLKELSRQLRGNMTDAERLLWVKIRKKQLNGYQFYRQKPIGDYIVDFYCPRAKLVVEVDGSQHFTEEITEYDRARDEYMNSLGLMVLRFINIDVMTHIEGVVERIEEKIPLSPPLQKGETDLSL
jgi:very-short-patch-repair endonuclease